MRLSGGGLSVALPPRWEGVIETAQGLDADAVTRRRAAVGAPPAMRPAVHLGNFALPASRGEFGSGAVELMNGGHAFVALVEYGSEEVGTPLFARRGIPRSVTADGFGPRMLQRTVAGQCGLQVFATEAGRAFCLYVVLGRRDDLAGLVAEVNGVLATLTVDHR